MGSIAYQFIQLESGLLLPFLAMLILIQLQRAGEAVYSIGNARRQALVFAVAFPVLAVIFAVLLGHVSPLMGLELAAGFTLALIHPVNALCLFVYLLFLRPWDIVTDNVLLAALPRLLAGTCFLSWILHPWQHSRPGMRASRALKLLLAFSVWLFLSTLVTPNIAEAQAAWFNTFFKSLIVFVMCSFFIENRRSLAEFKYTIMISIFSTGVLGIYQYFIADQARLGGVSMLDPNDLAAISVIAVPLALTPLFSRIKGMSERLVGLLFVAVSLTAIWYSQSRGALLALAAQVLGFQLIKNFHKRRFATLAGVAIVGLLYLGAMNLLTRKSDDMEESSESRKTYWKAATRMTLRNPLFGVGYDQYSEKYESYSYSLKYEWGKRTAHSSWFLVFAESGVLGGLLFMAFFMTVLRTAWRNRQQYPDQLYAIGGYGVAMSFLSHTYLLFPYILYGLILASDSVKEKTTLEPQ